MPQLNRGGKFVFGKSIIRDDASIQIPTRAIDEYHITDEGRVYLFTGNKITGGFCVTRKGLLQSSKLGHILCDMPELKNYTAKQGEFIKYKGRSYCWVDISDKGVIYLTEGMMNYLDIKPNMQLLSIRSSDIAFTMGAKGPLLKKAETMREKYLFTKNDKFPFIELLSSEILEKACIFFGNVRQQKTGSVRSLFFVGRERIP